MKVNLQMKLKETKHVQTKIKNIESSNKNRVL